MQNIKLMDAVRAGHNSETMNNWVQQEEMKIEQARVQLKGLQGKVATDSRYNGLKTVEFNERGEGFKLPARG